MVASVQELITLAKAKQRGSRGEMSRLFDVWSQGAMNAWNNRYEQRANQLAIENAVMERKRRALSEAEAKKFSNKMEREGIKPKTVIKAGPEGTTIQKTFDTEEALKKGKGVTIFYDEVSGEEKGRQARQDGKTQYISLKTKPPIPKETPQQKTDAKFMQGMMNLMMKEEYESLDDIKSPMLRQKFQDLAPDYGINLDEAGKEGPGFWKRTWDKLFGGGTPTFNSEEEALKSGLQPGTEVIINGRRAVL